ncbi:MAG: ferrochelatase [Propionibacteriaceae bacterium]|jgi:ferrochelatase|nr:ferrochelatase [Propionibacteriaceae bacterium]
MTPPPGPPAEVAVVWTALGTPTAPTAHAVRPFLREFLTDRRIVDLNPLVWRAILELFILPRRARVSARKYASVWLDDGSPLLIHSLAQVDALASLVTGESPNVRVELAVRYGEPSVATVLAQLRAAGVGRVLIVPAYPHYSQTTVGSIYDAVARCVLAQRDQPELRFVRSFPTQALYVEALARSIERVWEREGRPDFAAGDTLLLSYHGIPVAMAEAGDPYPQECAATTAALRVRLGLDVEACRETFQSKFGPTPWLTPATIDEVARLGAAGVRRIDVATPGFAADCLETLEEINLLNRERYAEVTAHQGKFVVVPCLNADPLFMSAVAGVIRDGLAGWI